MHSKFEGIVLINSVQIFDVNHLKISLLLLSFLTFIGFIFNVQKIKSILFSFILINTISFFCIMVFYGDFDYKIHLPLHLCYITELGILISLYSSSDIFKSWMLFNSSLGSVVALLNSNLTANSLFIEHIHFYFSHFNLALFCVYMYKLKFKLNTLHLISSIKYNVILLSSIVPINIILGSNYWFTFNKPGGVNLSGIMPDWPYYFIIMFILGILFYFSTFILFKSFSFNNN
ncbi:MAG: hypothetical protein CMG25_04405 [Candidatus Marinimicrobia bacterium]|nr:hypothetical protein [Candidatus Neomarinimicrobiota bacterium]